MATLFSTFTPLHSAAVSGDVNEVRSVLKHSWDDVNCTDSYGWTPLHYACVKGQLDVVRVLISEFNAYTSIQNISGATALMLAAGAGQADVVHALIHEYQCPLDTRDGTNRTVLHYACEGGNVSIVKSLICKHKADVYARDNQNNTPLHAAAYSDKAEVVLCLIDEFGCDSNLRGHTGQSLLHYACERGNVSLVKTLIHKHEADINACDDQNRTPLHLAAYSSRAVVLCLIREFSCNPNISDGDGNSLLHLACFQGHARLASDLLPLCSIFLTNNDGNTPLHCCASEGNVECVEVLLAANAPIFKRNKNGETPVDIAHYRAVLILEQYKKDHHDRLLADYETIQEHAKKTYSGGHRVIRLFVVGKPGVGKSSLVASLRREGFFKSIRRVSESSVPPHTAGIIPTEYYSKHYGRVLLYDFAGDEEYYSSHAAILENIASSKKGDNIFLVVVNLMDSNDDIKKHLQYWVSFIDQQKFSKKRLSVGIVGSHYDIMKAPTIISAFQTVLDDIEFSALGQPGYYLIDCCNPRCSGIDILQKQILSKTKASTRYFVSEESSVLLGLLKKDFGEVVACPVQIILSHIKDSGVGLPHEIKSFQPIILELHEIGVFLLIGDSSKEDSLVVMDSTKLTNEVHKLLFSEHALTHTCSFAKGSPINIGIMSGSDLNAILPPYITKECLHVLQYCQEIKPTHIKVFPSIEQSALKIEQSFFFFPALCRSNKSDTPWDTDSEFSYSIGWLARCTDPRDYFPPRFLHVLLLRLVFRYTLSVPAVTDEASGASPDPTVFKLHCTMWKTGVQWSMEEGVKCRVEMVSGNREVVVLVKSIENNTDNFTSIFNEVIRYVMEAKTEFCHCVRPEFFLLDSTSEADYLSDDNLFPMSDINRVLKNPEGKKMIFSVSRNGHMDISKLSFIHKLTFWDFLFPIKQESVFGHLENVHIENLLKLGLCLDIPRGVIETIKDDFPHDANRRMTEVLKKWMSSPLGFPCWWHLVEALKNAEQTTLAEEIASAHILDVQLQEKLLEDDTAKPDSDFLASFAGILGNKWLLLATSLSLTEEEIEEVKKEGLSQEDHTLLMLKRWVLKEDATYGQLYQTLKTVSLF